VKALQPDQVPNLKVLHIESQLAIKEPSKQIFTCIRRECLVLKKLVVHLAQHRVEEVSRQLV
jgi:hypothetical protein